MKKSFFLISIVTLTIISCKSSYTKIGDKNANYIPYYLKAYEADSLCLVGNYQRSYEILDSLFKKYEPANMDNVNEYSTYIACCVMTGNIENLDEKIRNGILKYGSIIRNHPDGDTIYTRLSKITKVSREEMKLLSQKNDEQYNTELRNRIIRMDDEDQNARIPVLNHSKMDEFQKKHEKEIDEIISEFGYPNQKVTGYMFNEYNEPVSFDEIFYHQTTENKKKYLPLLYDNLVKGKLSPNEYGGIVDKIYLDNGRLFYGTFLGEVPLINEKKIDSIRKTIGLPGYGYEEWAFKRIFPNQ
ncbi:hypothetical protein [Flavobacterium sp.]|jgi:hypothetical protein|uniref:hypothetical protein n=1 Tax=Flavobacterium sp. TaxID=239 RepID=UPI0037C12A82